MNLKLSIGILIIGVSAFAWAQSDKNEKNGVSRNCKERLRLWNT